MRRSYQSRRDSEAVQPRDAELMEEVNRLRRELSEARHEIKRLRHQLDRKR